VDRAAGQRYTGIFPGIIEVARTQRHFLARAVSIRQFLDVGTGLPTEDNTHEVAQRTAPDSRVVYVDNDPLVLVHARALLTSSAEGSCDYIDADLHDPGAIFDSAAAILDFSQPVGLMLMGIMGHITNEDAYPIVRQLVAALPPGSYLTLADGTDVSEAFRKAQRGYNNSGAVPYYLRSPAQIARFFEGLELVEPGVVPCADWRPGPSPVTSTTEAYVYGGVARKP
jgi:hypothetical protein